MAQQLLIGLFFLAALAQLGYILWKQWFAKSSAGCASGCNGCTLLDISKIEKQILQKQQQAVNTLSSAP